MALPLYVPLSAGTARRNVVLFWMTWQQAKVILTQSRAQSAAGFHGTLLKSNGTLTCSDNVWVKHFLDVTAILERRFLEGKSSVRKRKNGVPCCDVVLYIFSAFSKKNSEKIDIKNNQKQRKKQKSLHCKTTLMHVKHRLVPLYLLIQNSLSCDMMDDHKLHYDVHKWTSMWHLIKWSQWWNQTSIIDGCLEWALLKRCYTLVAQVILTAVKVRWLKTETSA